MEILCGGSNKMGKSLDQQSSDTILITWLAASNE